MARWPWPLPALLTWAACWGLFLVLGRVLPLWAAALAATGLGLAASLVGSSWWRRGMIAAGFPVALAVMGFSQLPAWLWLLPLGLLLLVYPLNAWRDAPLFPTPLQALDGLDQVAPLAAGERVLDGGCGLGDGLRALRQVYPQARLEGVEWSWALRWLCALRCPWARVRRGDLWATDWSAYRMIYLFQRPESMSRAAVKALGELQPGSWLVSLSFPLPGVRPQAQWAVNELHQLYVYQAPLVMDDD